MSTVIHFWRDETGATSIEYAIVATCLSLVIVGAARLIGTRLATNYFMPVANNLT